MLEKKRARAMKKQNKRNEPGSKKNLKSDGAIQYKPKTQRKRDSIRMTDKLMGNKGNKLESVAEFLEEKKNQVPKLIKRKLVSRVEPIHESKAFKNKLVE